MPATRRWRTLAALAAAAALLGGAGCGKKAAPPKVDVVEAGRSPVASIQDDRLYQFHGQLAPADADVQVAERIRDMTDLGARVIRVDLRWDLVAAAGRPADAANPDDPAYDWTAYDAIVTAARASNVEVLFTVYGTPTWAREPGIVAPRPASQPLAIRPLDPTDFGRFGAAAAARYGPQGVRKWEAWNEPNIALFLYPQFEERGGRWRASSPRVYSALLATFYENVKRVSPDAIIAGAVMAPVGDRCRLTCTRPTARVSPPEFVRALDAADLRPRMDVVSHHPYPQVPPESAGVRRPFSVDLYNLDTLVQAIDGTYLHGKALWLSEYGYNTERTPSYRLSVTRDQQAAALSDAYRRVRALGPRAQLMTYYLLQDNSQWKSGLLDEGGVPKPSRAAFPMPLVAGPAGGVAAGAEVTLTGQVRPATGATTVTLEMRDGDSWKKLKAVTTGADGTYAVSLAPARTMAIRARWSGRSRSGRHVDAASVPVEIPVRTGP